MNSTTPSADEFFFVALICSPLQVYSAQRTAKCRNRHQIETSYSNRMSLVNFPVLRGVLDRTLACAQCCWFTGRPDSNRQIA